MTAAVQFAYPQVYYACHTRHQRRRSNEAGLSVRDLEILVHLDRRVALTLSELARHMDLAPSTLSEALSALVELGCVIKTTAPGRRDRRRVGLLLTARGIAAVRSGSVLETARVKLVLRRMAPDDRHRVCEALTILARACRNMGTREERS